MRSARWVAIAILSIFGVFAFLPGAAERAEAQSYEAAELEMIELINAYRQQNGLGALSLSSPLSVAAEHHSEDMGTYGFFAHDTVQSSYYQPGWGHAERAAQEGYDYNTYTAENLAYGQATAQETFEAWRNSPGHNAAMLGDYSVVGVGLVNIGGVPYWTTVFGAHVDSSVQPTGVAPSGAPDADTSSTTSTNTRTNDTGTTDTVTNQSAQYDDTIEQTETATEDRYVGTGSDVEQSVADERYDSGGGSDTPPAVEGQYDDAEEDANRVAAEEQYDALEQAADDERDDAVTDTPDISVANRHRADAERFQAAAEQYRANAERAAAEITALEQAAAQPQPTGTQSTDEAPPTESSPPTESQPAPAGQDGLVAVTPEPQVSAPPSASEEQQIPVANEIASSTGSLSVSSGDEAGDVSGEERAEGVSGEDEAAAVQLAARQAEKPSEAMALVGITVLPDTGGLPLGGVLGAVVALITGGLVVAARRISG